MNGTWRFLGPKTFSQSVKGTFKLFPFWRYHIIGRGQTALVMNPPIMRGYASIQTSWAAMEQLEWVILSPVSQHARLLKNLATTSVQARMSASTASPRVHTTLREEQGKQEPLGAAMQKGMGHVLPACSSPFLILAIWKADGGESSIRELPITEA